MDYKVKERRKERKDTFVLIRVLGSRVRGELLVFSSGKQGQKRAKESLSKGGKRRTVVVVGHGNWSETRPVVTRSHDHGGFYPQIELDTSLMRERLERR